MTFEAIIFDMDGVLIDSEPLWKKAEIKAFGEVGLKITEIDCQQTVGMRIDEAVQFWYNKSPWEDKSVTDVANRIMDLLIALVYESGVALPGVKETLGLLSKQNVKIALATSSYESVMNAVLDKLEIRKFFEVVRSAQVEQYGKPHPAVYLNTAKLINTKPENCLVIEDSFTGMLSGLSAKMKVAVIPEKSHQIDERLKIANFHFDSMLDFREAITNQQIVFLG